MVVHVKYANGTKDGGQGRESTPNLTSGRMSTSFDKSNLQPILDVQKEAQENVNRLALDLTQTTRPSAFISSHVTRQEDTAPPILSVATPSPSAFHRHTRKHTTRRSHALQITTIASIMPQARAIQHLSNPTTNPPTRTPYPHRQDHLSPKRTPWRHPLQWNHLSPSRDRGFPQGLEMFHGVRQG